MKAFQERNEHGEVWFQLPIMVQSQHSHENFPRQIDIPQNLIYTDGDAKRFCQDWAVRVEPQCGMKNGDRTKEGLLVKFNIKVPLLLLIMMIPMQSQTAAEK